MLNRKYDMTDQSMLDNTAMTNVAPQNPHEIALQSLCKQLLKSRLFRGFYLERRYVENIAAYRDVVCLQKSEKGLDKMLRDIRDKLQLFYIHQNPNMWIGITSGSLVGLSSAPLPALQTYLWVELNDVAFGQYWFSIKTIRFRENEIILKLKEVQPIEEDEAFKWAISATSNKEICDNSKESLETSIVPLKNSSADMSVFENQITVDDFVLLLQQWKTSIKQTIYDFMAQDISKENIKSVLRFLGLLIFSLLSGAVIGVKLLGIFTLRLVFELSRLTHTLTPIILKIIELFNKIIGGFYILLAMIWKDTVVNRNQPKHDALEYNRPVYKSIQYEEREKRYSSSFKKPFQ